MKDGLYKVEFQTGLGAGAGVVTIENGRLRGGDSGMFYIGQVTQNGNTFSAEVTTNRHTHVPGQHSVFGKDQVKIRLEGRSTETSADVVGTAAEAPGVIFKARLERIAD